MTIKEIAKLAETSISSVSRVLNDSGYVKEEVRIRIKKVVEETGYIPNYTARSLKIKSNDLIGILIPKISSYGIGRYLDGIMDSLNGKKYQSLIVNTRNNTENEFELLKVLAEKSVKGIIVLGTSSNEDYLKFYKKYNIPMIIIGQDMSDMGIVSVIQDEKKALFELTDAVLKKGRKNIGILGVDSKDTAIGVERIQGIKDSLKKHNLECNKIVRTGFSFDDGYEGAKKLIEDNKNLDYIVAVTDTLAIGAMNYLIDNDIQIKTDISITGVGGTNLAKMFNPRLTTIAYDYYKSGIVGAKNLLALIDNQDVPKKIVLNYEVLFRETD